MSNTPPPEKEREEIEKGIREVRAGIGAILYFLFCIAAIITVFFGLAVAADGHECGGIVLAGIVFYLIGRDVRHILRQQPTL